MPKYFRMFLFVLSKISKGSKTKTKQMKHKTPSLSHNVYRLHNSYFVKFVYFVFVVYFVYYIYIYLYIYIYTRTRVGLLYSYSLDETGNRNGIVLIPAHTTMADVGLVVLSTGVPLWQHDRKANAEAVRLAKLAATGDRVSEQLRKRIIEETYTCTTVRDLHVYVYI